MQLGCKQFTGSHSSKIVCSTCPGTLNHMSHYQELAAKALANKDLIESDPFIHLQHFIAGKVLSEESKKVIESLSTTQRVIVESAQGKIARVWLSAIPAVKSLAVPSDLMRIAVKLFLSVPSQGKAPKVPSLLEVI